MIDFELYAENTSFVKESVKNVFSNYGNYLQWKVEGEVILDIGCGDGWVTNHILRHIISNNSNAATLKAVDIDDNLLYHAKKKYANSNIIFEHMDISSEESTDKYTNSVDKIFSFYCYQWCPDLKICFKNIHKMLKPDGSTFNIILCKNTTMRVIYQDLISPKWRKYVKKEWMDMMAGPLLQLDNPEFWMEDILKDCSLDVKICKVIRDEYTFSDFEKLRGFILAFPAMYEDIPQQLRESLFEELRITIREKWRSLTFPIDFLLVVASKQ